MKKKLLYLVFTIAITSYSQTPIANYFSDPGSQYAIVSGTIDNSPSGANAVWNFGVLTQSGTNTDTFAVPTAGELALYPLTTEVLTFTDNAMNTNQVFYELVASTLSLTGASNSQFTLDYNLDNALIGTFPLAYGYSNTDAIAGQITAQGQTATYTGTISNIVNAYGTLSFSVTGLGSFTGSITRIRTDQLINFSLFGVFPGTGSITNYNYYNDANGSLLFRTTDGVVSVQAFGINELISTREALITNTLSLDNLVQAENAIKLYPNPVQNRLIISLSDGIDIQSINIMDVNGRRVLFSSLNESNLDVTSLMSGIYFISIESNIGVINRKFIKL